MITVALALILAQNEDAEIAAMYCQKGEAALKKHDIAGPEFAKIAETLADLATKWFGKKRYGAARRAAESALELDPSNRSAKQTLEKLNALEGKDLLGGEEKWSLTAGRDVKRGDDGLVLNGISETVSIQHPSPGSGDSVLLVSLRVDKLGATAVVGAGLGDALLLVLRQDKNGATVEIHALENREWKKKESAPLAVPLKEGAKFDLEIRLRGGAVAILVNADGRRVGECGLAKGAPAEFKAGLYCQGATVTFTSVRLRTT